MFENHTICLFISTPHEGKLLTVNNVDSVNDICFKSYDQSCRLNKPKLMILRFNPNICMCYEEYKLVKKHIGQLQSHFQSIFGHCHHITWGVTFW